MKNLAVHRLCLYLLFTALSDEVTVITIINHDFANKILYTVGYICIQPPSLRKLGGPVSYTHLTLPTTPYV